MNRIDRILQAAALPDVPVESLPEARQAGILNGTMQLVQQDAKKHGCKRVIRIMIAAAAAIAVLCGAAVSFAGLVGFVGLLVPHAARFLVGTRHRDLLLASMLLGALLVTVCDLLGRVLFAPFELPVGILLSLLGGPFFLWLLFRQRGGRRL